MQNPVCHPAWCKLTGVWPTVFCICCHFPVLSAHRPFPSPPDHLSHACALRHVFWSWVQFCLISVISTLSFGFCLKVFVLLLQLQSCLCYKTSTSDDLRRTKKIDSTSLRGNFCLCNECVGLASGAQKPHSMQPLQ